MSKNLRLALTLSLLFIFLIRLQPIWERYPGGFWNSLFYLIITVLFCWMLVRIVIELRKLRKLPKINGLKPLLPLAVLSLFLMDGCFNPAGLDLDRLYGNVTFRACYEGTQNQAHLKLRQGDQFDLHWTGAFFYDEFYTGHYAKRSDTLLLRFDDTDVPSNLDDTLVIREKAIYRVTGDTVLSTGFYVGYCKGLN